MREADTIDYLSELSQLAIDFVSLPPQTDIYVYLAQRLKTLIGDSAIVVCSYDSNTNQVHQRAIVGMNKALTAASELVGMNIKGARQKIEDSEILNQIQAGHLVEIQEGIYDIFNRKVPRKVAHAVERLLNIKSLYGMGVMADGECFGTIVIGIREGEELPPVAVVEAYINVAAVALQRQQTEEALQESKQRYHALMEQSVIKTSDRERRILGSDLHDSVGQHLAGIALLSRALQSRLKQLNIPEQDDAARMTTLLQECLTQTRRIAQGLQPVEMTSQRLDELLEHLAKRITATFSVNCTFECSSYGELRDRNTAYQLYLIAQEAASNAARHAHPQSIEINLTVSDSSAELSVRDDGKGISEKDKATDGLGLHIMQHRAEMIGGKLDIDGHPHGTTISCRLPIEDPE